MLFNLGFHESEVYELGQDESQDSNEGLLYILLLTSLAVPRLKEYRSVWVRLTETLTGIQISLFLELSLYDNHFLCKEWGNLGKSEDA